MLNTEDKMKLLELETAKISTIQDAEINSNAKDKFDYYIPEIMPFIQAIQDSGRFAYNSTVLEALKESDLFKGLSDNILNHYIYTTQGFKRGLALKQEIDKLEVNLKEQGFKPLTVEEMEQLATTRKYITIYRKGLGEIKARLLKDGAGKYMWLKPKYTTRGYYALIGDYIKM